MENKISEDVYRKISYLKIMIGLLICILVTVIMVILEKHYTGAYLENTLNIMVPVIAVLVYSGIKKISLTGFSSKTAKMISSVGSCVFGMYLIEYLGQKLFINFYLWMCDRTFGLIACSIYVICILFSTCVVVWGLKKIKFISRYI